MVSIVGRVRSMEHDLWSHAVTQSRSTRLAVAGIMALFALLSLAFDIVAPASAYGLLALVGLVAASAFQPVGDTADTSRLAGVSALLTALIWADAEGGLWIEPSAIGAACLCLVVVAAGPLNSSLVLFAQILVVQLVLSLAVLRHAGSALGPTSFAGWAVVAVLASALSGLLMWLRARTAERMAEATDALAVAATHDRLTGLLNRRGMEQRMAALLDHSDAALCYVTIVDIDWLKTANDAHGHAFGDDVIRNCAMALRALAPQDALVARWGGDEFLMFGMGQTPDAADLERRVTQHISDSNFDCQTWPRTISAGSATLMITASSLDNLIRSADQDMYERRVQRRSRI